MGSFTLKTANALRKVYRDRVFKRHHKLDIKDHIRLTTDTDIPELTDEQKNEIMEYWKQFGIRLSSTEWYKYYYAKTGIFDPRFVPDDVFHRIIRLKLNNYDLAVAWSDKAFTDWVVRDVKTVRSVIRSVNGRLLNETYELIDKAEANRILNQYESLVLKPTMFTDTGKNVVLQQAPFDIESIIKKYGRFFVVQIPMEQHYEFARLNESSVNTIRVNTVLFDNKAYATSGFIKVGQPGEFADNGGGKKRIFIGIRDGRYTDFAYDHDCNKFSSIPSEFSFSGKQVPFYKMVCEAVECAHTCIPHFGLAFWDVSVDRNGEPVIVEMNLRYPDTYVPQIGCGPFFGEYTENVLEYIRYV